MMPRLALPDCASLGLHFVERPGVELGAIRDRLGPILEQTLVKFWSFGMSAINFEQILEWQNQSNLGSKRYLSLQP